MTAPTDRSELSTVDPELTDARFEALVQRLSEQSVRKHFDAYEDVPWEDFAIDPADPRWELGETDPLGRTEWYRNQPQETRARIGLHSIASKMKTGHQFEGVLMQGLIQYAQSLPNGDPAFRYCYHEIIEEGQHTLMFQEFVNRAGIEVPGMPWWARLGAGFIPFLGRAFPELFFMFVLGGEDPIDHVQREKLREAGSLHPLLERIMRIHVTEEARHLSYARHHLKQAVPRMSRAKRFVLSIAAPRILTQMSRLMLSPSKDLVRTYGVPADVVRQAYRDDPQTRASGAAALRKVRVLCRELGLMNPVAVRVWRRGGIWAAD